MQHGCRDACRPLHVRKRADLACTHACIRACTHGCTSATACLTRIRAGHDARFWHACMPFMARCTHAHIYMLACSNTCTNTLFFIHTHTHAHTPQTLTQHRCRELSSNIGLPATPPPACKPRGRTRHAFQRQHQRHVCLNCRWDLLLLLFEREVLAFILR